MFVCVCVCACCVLHLRAEREGKALRTEVCSLKDDVTSLRARLACVQGRRQAEHEQANNKIKVHHDNKRRALTATQIGHINRTVRDR